MSEYDATTMRYSYHLSEISMVQLPFRLIGFLRDNASNPAG
jgi:hypothetical protein